ncbi:MAG TPA: hypothetical protein VM344_01885 [Vitreimonas sp.]|nr:hypothetical protein [Vitreimonas sp.]
MGSFFTSGEWIVKAGQEDQFFAAWTAAKEPDPPLAGIITPPRLLRDLRTPGRFVSFAEFGSLEAIEEFRSRPDFGSIIGAMREHLDEMSIFTFEQVIAP